MRFCLLLILAGLSLTSVAGAQEIPDGVDPALRFLIKSPAIVEARDVVRLASEGRRGLPFPRAYLSESIRRTGHVDVLLQFDGAAPRLAADWTRLPQQRVLARVTPLELKRIAEYPGLLRARMSRPMFLALDKSTAYVNADQVRTLDSATDEFAGATGQGVVVGLVDSGVDYRHPDFNTPQGKTRLLSLWDQIAPGTPPSGYSIGNESNPSQLNSPVFRPPVVDRIGHGTHVLGIAAGNGLGSSSVPGAPRYSGLAPGAALVGVRAPLTEFHVALGVRYIFGVAEQHGLPAVVNLSLGSHFGPHDGNTEFERVLETMVGPGRILVAAAGNSHEAGLHAEVQTEGAKKNVPFLVPQFRRGESVSYVTMEGWYPRGREVKFSLTDPDGVLVGTWSLGDQDAEHESKHGRARGWHVNDGAWGSFMLDIEDTPLDNMWGEWNLSVEPETGDTGALEVDFWLVGWNLNTESPRFTAHVDAEETVISPATSREIISVGAVATRSCWPDEQGGDHCFSRKHQAGEVAWFTSQGPTNDGRPKPELYAPGYGVIAPLSSAKDRSFFTESDFDARSLYDELYWVNLGTSMAAPHVVGTVALLLEKEPTLTKDQVLRRLVSRGRPSVDQRTSLPIVELDTKASVLPAAAVLTSGFTALEEGIELRWTVDGSLPGRQYVERAVTPEGPYLVLSGSVEGGNPYRFFDSRPEPGRQNYYRVRLDDDTGMNDEIAFFGTPPAAGMPQIRLHPMVPNPARGSTTLHLSFPEAVSGTAYKLSVFDIQGRLVHRLEEGRIAPGGEDREVVWDLYGTRGRLTSGVYFLRLEAGNTVVNQRLVILPQ